ncbi:MAG: ShlB/FhaC/HecB family hemolysin secretion/activation protein [Nitrosomonadales bacterium]|nr:ShlB/FhaC/HecB family hemolysin secretion/activation protein [Nitrosomonadales bacterium]
MKHKSLSIPLFWALLGATPWALAAGGGAAAAVIEQPPELRFDIVRYLLEGATLLSQTEVDAAVSPYVGKRKDFSDVQRALEAIEEAYAKRGFSAVHVLLPEQELEKGTVRFRVVESRFGKVEVKDNRYVSVANVLNALPSLRSGGVPRSAQLARELKLANENPARQLNAILKAGEKDEEIDTKVIVTDSKPSSWNASFDNTGSAETGYTRLGISYRHANLFDADHVATLQYVTSPQHPDRVKVVGASYKVPLYESGNSMEFFGGYSNVNALVSSFSNFRGGGLLLSVRYNFLLERMGKFDPRFSVALDRRDFKRIEMINGNTSSTVYNEIVVMPVSLTYAVQGRLDKSDVNFNLSYSANIPGSYKGTEADFAAYDNPFNPKPQARYRVLRYGASYARAIGDGGAQFRVALNGQSSSDVLIQGEQMRLGGADAVRGFSEGSEGGATGMRLNVEGYTPDFGSGDWGLRALVFYDRGQARPANSATTVAAGAGLGLRASFTERYAMRLDWAQIKQIENPSAGQTQRVGDIRWHASLNASF